MRIPYPFLPAISRGLGVSLAAGGWLITVRAVTGVGAPFFGALTDRLGGRRVMLWGLLLLAGGAALVATFPLYLAALAGFAILGLSKSAYDPAMQAYVGARVAYGRRARALGLTELAWSATWLAMPLVGWLIARVNWRAPFALLALVGLACWALTRRALPPLSLADPRGSTRFASIWHDRRAWLVPTISGLLMAAQDNFFVVYGAWMEDRFRVTVTALGLVSVVLGLAEVAGELGVVLLVDRLGKRRAVQIGLMLLGVGHLFLPRVAVSTGAALAATAAVVLVFEFTIVSLVPLVSGLNPEARGTMMSLNVAAMSAGRMIAAPLGVRLYQDGGLVWNGLVSAGVCLSLLIVLGFVHEREH